MNSINFINPIRKPEDAVEVETALIQRLEDGRIGIALGRTDASDSFYFFTTQQVFDKLAIAVVQFVQSEAVKSQQEKKA